MNEFCLEVKDLKKHFKTIKAVDGISFKVNKGIIFGMLGPNGAGKSTTIESLVGLHARDSGEINILGLDPQKDKEQLKEKLGVQLQSPALFERLKVEELLSLFASFYQDPFPVNKIMEMIGLEEKKNEYTKSLSGGQRHRLAVGLAIVSNGEIIFLDEPTTGLDPQARRKLWEVIFELKKLGKTVFLTTHYMDEAEKLCDQLLIIDHGKVIASGTPANLIKEHFDEDAIEFTNPSFAKEELNKLNNLTNVIDINYNHNNTILLYSTNASNTISDLLSFAKKQGKEINDLNLRKPSLEDLFLKLTGRKIRK